MEYILEELLRQRKALAILMNGGSAEKQDDGGNESTDRWSSGDVAPAETVWDAFTETAGEENGYRASTRRNGGGMGAGRNVWDALTEDAAAESGAASAGKTAAERAGWQRGRLDSGERTSVRNVGLSGGAGAVEAVSVRTVTRWDGGTAETDARALSRAVQRDARRYDGGFMAR